jgi:putative tryptophan/tyrosine transport system substrate-binding protein
MQFDQLKRRDFITLLGGGAVVPTMLWPLSARAQQPGRMRRVGVLLAYAEGDREAQRRIVAFQQSLHGLGWTDGGNIHVDYRFAAGDLNRMRTYAAEIVRSAPDAIVAESTPVLSVMQTETHSIPIVFVLIADPVGQRLVQSLARPGGNMTGFAGTEPTMGGKLLELLKEIAPSVKRVAILFNPKTAPYVAKYLSVINAVSASFAVDAIAMPIKDATDIEHAIESFALEPNGGLLFPGDITTIVHSELIVALGAKHRLPAIYTYSFWVARGGLMSYGIDPVDMYRRAASYVDRILRGEKPADLPVQFPTKFELAINLKTAKAIGLKVPPTLLTRADEVIE